MSESTPPAQPPASESDFVRTLNQLAPLAQSAIQSHAAYKSLAGLYESGFVPEGGEKVKLALLDGRGQVLCDVDFAHIFPADAPEERKAKLETVLSAFLDGAARGLVSCLKAIQDASGKLVAEITAANTAS